MTAPLELPPMGTACEGPGVKATQLAFVRRLCNGCGCGPEVQADKTFVTGWAIEDADDSDRGMLMICRGCAMKLVIQILEAELG